MRRGDVVTVSAPGDYGKPRPAVVVQADAINEAEPASVILSLVTSQLHEAPLLRLRVEPMPQNGLQRASDVMLDKLFTVPVAKVGAVIGHLSDQQLVTLNRQLAFVLGLA